MNERIKELELVAITYADSKVPVMDRYNDIYHSIVRGKFAELIIEECIAQCWSVSELEHNGYVLSECSKRVRKHFGVE